MCWALWWYVRQSDMLGFVGVLWALWWYVRQSDMLGFVGVLLSARYVGLCGSTFGILICWALYFTSIDLALYDCVFQ